jgi:hypothetical protein
MSLVAKRLQRRIVADTAQLKVRLSGQLPWDVIGMVDDLPVADDDPAAIRPALRQGRHTGAAQPSQHPSQHLHDAVRAPPRRQSRR